VKLVDKKS